jgi:hypothetical protein
VEIREYLHDGADSYRATNSSAMADRGGVEHRVISTTGALTECVTKAATFNDGRPTSCVYYFVC